MLWPDQCVGVTPRCYSINEAAVQESLHDLFDEIPEGATHVQVNCQADALVLSRVVYAFADGLEKSTPTIILWVITIFLFTIMSLAWCGYACFRYLCLRQPRHEYVLATQVGDYKAVQATTGSNHGEHEKLVQMASI